MEKVTWENVAICRSPKRRIVNMTCVVIRIVRFSSDGRRTTYEYLVSTHVFLPLVAPPVRGAMTRGIQRRRSCSATAHTGHPDPDSSDCEWAPLRSQVSPRNKHVRSTANPSLCTKLTDGSSSRPHNDDPTRQLVTFTRRSYLKFCR